MRLRFGDCVFDPDTRQLVRAGQPVPVPPKVFELLDALIRERPRAVSKTDLHQRLWPDTSVADANLTNLVADLRDALGDDARHPRVIRTVQCLRAAEWPIALAPADGEDLSLRTGLGMDIDRTPVGYRQALGDQRLDPDIIGA